jgi:endonuclease/exonuclease/phosphatase family metal-dependent hydrolase
MLFLCYVYFANYHPDDVLCEPVYNNDNAPVLVAGQSIKVLSWNIQFLAGNRNNHFFFDGGSDPWPDKNVIDHTLSEVVRVIHDEDPDIVLFQEVDDGSERTFNEDQLQRILANLPDSLHNHTSSFYWKSHYILHPDIMGSAGMKLSTISKYRIDKAIRYALSPITTDNLIRRQFSPKRAMLEAYFPISNGQTLRAINTHLSAFAQGSNTMEKQIEQVDKLLIDIEKNNGIGFAGGDFNLIPPGNAYRRLSAFNKRYYNELGTELAPLFEKYLMVPGLNEVNGENYQRWYTNMATDSDPKVPDKTIDYFIFANGLKPDTAYVRMEDTIHISDHLPLIINVTIPQ